MPPARSAGWVDPDECRLDDFRALVEQATELADYPFADAVEQNVLIYGDRLRAAISDRDGRRAVQAELAQALLEGPGVLMFKRRVRAAGGRSGDRCSSRR